MSRGDGGAAFPCQPRDQQGGFVDEMQPGMTLRDKFADSVLPALYTGLVIDAMSGSGWPDNWRAGIAHDAYAIADAMLAARGES